MYEMERIAVIIKPTQLFLNWVKSIPGDANSNTMELKDLREDCTTLLIPPFESPTEAQEYIEEIYEDLFNAELESWCTDSSLWPKKRDYYTFKSWFDLEYHSIVYDLVEGGHEDDEDQDEDEEEYDDEDDYEKDEGYDDDDDDDDDYSDESEEEWIDDDDEEQRRN